MNKKEIGLVFYSVLYGFSVTADFGSLYGRKS